MIGPGLRVVNRVRPNRCHQRSPEVPSTCRNDKLKKARPSGKSQRLVVIFKALFTRDILTLNIAIKRYF